MNWVGVGVVVGYNVKKAIFVNNKLLFLECNNFLVEINLKIIRRHDFSEEIKPEFENQDQSFFENTKKRMRTI